MPCRTIYIDSSRQQLTLPQAVNANFLCQSRSMFSSSIVRRGPSSIVKPRCSPIGLGQLSTTAAASAARAGTPAEACTRQAAAAFRAAATIGQSKKSPASRAPGRAGYGSRFMLEREPTSTVGHRNVSRSGCAPLEQARTFGGGATKAVHARGGLKVVGRKQSFRPAVGASTHRWFATGDGPADTDTEPDSESESEFEGTIFGATPLEPAASPASSAVAEVVEPPAKKKASKGRRPRKRRTSTCTSSSSSESTPSADPAADAAEAEIPGSAAAAGEAMATKKPRARKPRKRRTAPSKGDSTPSPPAEPEEGEEEGEGAGGSGVDIPKSRKAAFERARRAGVAQRAREEGGRVPLDTKGDGGRSGGGGGGFDSDSLLSSEEEEEEDSDDEDEHDSSPSSTSWQEPEKPVRPEGFPSSFSVEGSANAAKRRTQQRKGAQQEQKQEQHPVLGHFVADLKYKRIYVTSIDALVQAPVWEKSRTLRVMHAAEIFQSQKLDADKLEIKMIEAGKIEAIGDMDKKAKGLPGVITLFRRPLLPLTRKQQKYTLGIVDGQHRLGALLMLAEEGLWDRSEQNVVVEVFDTKNEKEIESLFLDINKAEPIELDLGQPRPGDAQKCADEVVLHLYKEFRPMFGSKRARPPTLHAITFKENLVRSGMIERHELFDPELLLDYLLRVNEMLSERDMELWELMIGREGGGYNSKKSLLTALKKAKRHEFWLGMEMSWMLV